MAMTEVDVRADALSQLEEAVRYRELVDKMMLNAVKAARDAGATWEQLGSVLKISHQGARSTWQRKLKGLQNGSAR
jgi:hypothetical protein